MLKKLSGKQLSNSLISFIAIALLFGVGLMLYGFVNFNPTFIYIGVLLTLAISLNILIQTIIHLNNLSTFHSRRIVRNK
jgi:ABC-type multidrug transport system permease subunit